MTKEQSVALDSILELTCCWGLRGASPEGVRAGDVTSPPPYAPAAVGREGQAPHLGKTGELTLVVCEWVKSGDLINEWVKSGDLIRGRTSCC